MSTNSANERSRVTIFSYENLHNGSSLRARVRSAAKNRIYDFEESRSRAANLPVPSERLILAVFGGLVKPKD